MKAIFKYALAALICAVAFASCSKSGGTVTPVSTTTLPSQISSLVSTAILDSLQLHGAVINKGTTPPTVNGIFLIHPNVCLFDNSPGKFAGQTFDDYKYKFSSQDNTKFSITVAYLDTNTPGIVLSDSTQSYISGSGNLFSIFTKVHGIKNGVSFVILHLLSGEVVSGGIKNFQNTTYLVSKDADPNSYVEPQGVTRLFYDSDFLSEVQAFFNEA